MKSMKQMLEEDEHTPHCCWCGGTSKLTRLAQLMIEDGLNLPCCELASSAL